MATIAEQVQQIYIGLLGRAAEKAGLDYWVDEITTGKITLDQVRANFVSSQDEYITGIGQMSRPDAITALYQNLFERAPEAEGLAYWNTGGGKDIAIDGLLFALIDGAALSDATALNNKTEVADYYTAATAAGQAYDAAKAAAVIANVGADAQSVVDGKALVDGVNGDSVNLTVNQDNLTGTASADTFNAYIFDNQNTAQSGDMVDGGAGTDRLYADIGNSQKFAITLNTESVEQFAVRAETSDTSDQTDNNLEDNVTIDAERMEGTNWYESNNSRADVIIEDVRIERVAAYGDDTDQITRDITVAMVSTDPGNVDLGVYFDQHSLVKSGAAVSNSITLNVGNQLENALGFDAAKPLDNIPYDQVSFVVNGTTVTLNIDLTGVDTYAQMFVALQAAFATEKQTNAALLDVNLTRTLLTEDFISKDGENRQADEYILTTENGTIEPAAVGWNASAGLPSNNAFSASVVKGDSTTTSSLITSTVVLDDVGRGSMGGDLVIGGLSTGDTSDSKGVEQFDITVERSSELQEIQSTNNTLREVFIKNGAVKGDLVVAGDTNSDNDLPGADADTAGFTDVRVVDASAMEGKVSINAALSDKVVSKYLDSKDNAADASADNVDFLYKLGTNDDKLDLTISNANLAAAGTGSREDFVLNIEGNGGDDVINTIIGNGAGTNTTPWYINQKDNANLTIDGGAGNDTISTKGAGDFVIDAGAGNDTVYANNDGNPTASATTGVTTSQSIVLTDGGNTGLSDVGDTMSITVNGVTYTHTATAAQTLDSAAAALAVLVQANPTVSTATYAAGSNTLTVTSTTDSAVSISGYAVSDGTGTINGGDTAVIAQATAGVDEQLATYSLSLAGVVLDATDTLTVTINGSAVVLHTSAGVGEDESDVITAVSGTTIAIDGITYDITSTGAGNVTLTQQTGAAADYTGGNATLTAQDVSTNGNATIGGSTSPQASTQDGLQAVAEIETVTVTDVAAAGLEVGDTISITVDVDGAGAGAPVVITHTAAVAETQDAALTALAADIQANAGIATATYGAPGSGIITITDATEDAAGITVSNLVVTDNNTDNSTGTSGAVGAQSTSTTTTGVSTAATWVSNAAASGLEINNLVGNGAGPKNVMEGLKLTVAFSGANTAGSSGVINGAAVANTLGFESTVTISTADKLGDNNTINQAIKKAINDDAVLSKLLVATDGPSDTLVIKSLVDGTYAATDLAITLVAPTLTEVAAWSASEKTAVGTAVNDLANTSGAAITDAATKAALDAAVTAQGASLADVNFAKSAGVDIVGSASNSDSDNTITLGSGDDVAVLGTDGTSNDTLVFEGSFGNDSIFNFEQSGAAVDTINFNAYLGGKTSVSNSAASQVDIANTVDFTGVAAHSATADQIVVINDFAATATKTWANLTESALLNAIKDTGTVTHANIVANTLDVAAQPANFVGDVQKNIVMVENNGVNAGEYKVFEVTSSATTDEFTAVKLVGTIDFGAEITAATAFV